MSQIVRKFIKNDAVNGTKIRLDNAEYLRSRNAADSADINILKVNASDRIEFASVPQSTSDAIAANDLVRFSQLSALAEGMKAKEAVVVATLVAGALATDFAAGQVVDGHTLVAGERILIQSQTLPEENGIYVVQASGAPVRAADFNAISEIPGAYTVAELGSQAGYVFVTTSSPAILGTDPIVFVTRTFTAITGGDMITVSGGVVSVDLLSTGGLVSSNPGNATGQLEIKVDVTTDSFASLAIGANGTKVKFDASRSLSVDTNGLGINLASVSGLQHSTNQLAIKLEASNPTLKIDGSNQLGVKLDAAGAIVTGASGIKSQVDAATVKINGSNQLESLKEREEAITLSGTDITNQYVDLSFAIYGTSASVNSASLFVVGGPMQEKTVDYTVSLAGGAGGVTRISFAGDLATGGAAELIATDKLVIRYSYLT